LPVKATSNNVGLVSSFSLTKKSDVSIESAHCKVQEKTFSFPKGKKKRCIPSSLAFIPRTFQKPIIFAISEPFFQLNKQFSSILFWGNGKRGPPAVI
jgi:hypothetical protein